MRNVIGVREENLMVKQKKTHCQNIKGLLNKYKEEEIEYIKDKGYFR